MISLTNHDFQLSTCLFSQSREKKVPSPKGHGPVGVQGLPGGVGAHAAKAHRGEDGQDLNSGSHVATFLGLVSAVGTRKSMGK